MKRIFIICLLCIGTLCSAQLVVIGDNDLSEIWRCTTVEDDYYPLPDFKAGLLYYRILSQYSDTIVEVYDSACDCDEDANYSQLDTCIIPQKVIYEGKSYTVKGIGVSVFLHCSKLKKVVLPNTITYIAHGNFMYCDSLLNINIPTSIKRVGPTNFGMNPYVENMYKQLPDSIERTPYADINPW